MKNKSIFFIAVLMIIVPLAIWMQFKTNQRAKKNFALFNETEIDAVVASVEIAHHGTLMSLEDGREFIFYPITNQELNQSKKFNYTAEKGDKVHKAAYADTLYLFHADQKLAYTFKKFD